MYIDQRHGYKELGEARQENLSLVSEGCKNTDTSAGMFTLQPRALSHDTQFWVRRNWVFLKEPGPWVKKPPPKPYLPPQTRTRHRRSHRPHVPMLMRGNAPPTTRSPPHQSRQKGNPPNRQPATVGEEELGGRDPTSRRTSMRAAPDCRPPLTARHASQPRSSTSHPPPATRSSPQARGRGPVPAQDRCAAPHGRLRAAPGPRPRRRPPRRRSPTRHVPRQQQQAGGNEDILS
jgi:hypothetical protein